MGVVKFDQVRPSDAPGAGGNELSVGGAVKPVRMVRLQGRRPASMVGGEVDEEAPALRMHGADQLAELIERRRVGIEFRHRGVDTEEVGRRKRASIFAHHRIGCGHGEDGQCLDDSETHRVHDEVEPARNLAEGSELPREDGVDRIAAPRLRGLDLHRQVAALRPFGHGPTLGEEAALAMENADLAQGHRRFPDAWRRLHHRNIAPLLLKRRHAFIVLFDCLATRNDRAADLRTERGAPPAGRVKRQGDLQQIALPAEMI